MPHPVSPAKAAYLSFKLSGFLAHNSTSTAFSTAAGVSSSSSPLRNGSIPQPASLQAIGTSSQMAGSSSPWRVGLWTPWSSEGSVSPGLPNQGLAGVRKYPAYVEVTLAAVPRPQSAVVVTDPAAGIRPALPTGYGSGFEIGMLVPWQCSLQICSRGIGAPLPACIGTRYAGNETPEHVPSHAVLLLRHHRPLFAVAAGRMPVSLLYMPRAMHGTKGKAGMYSTMGSGARQLSVDDAFGGYVDEALLLLESRLHRPHTHTCQVSTCICAPANWLAKHKPGVW